MTSKISCAVCLCACLVGLVAISQIVAQDNPTAAPSDLEALMQRHRELSQAQSDSLELHFKSGSFTYAQILLRRNTLLEAELEVETDATQRLKLFEKRLANFTEMELQVKGAVEVGQADTTSLLASQAAKVRAEIMVLRAKEAVESEINAEQ